MRCNWRPLPVGSICRSKTLAFTAFWSTPDSRLNDAVKVSAMQEVHRAHTPNTFITSSPKWLMTFTAMRPLAGRANGREVSE